MNGVSDCYADGGFVIHEAQAEILSLLKRLEDGESVVIAREGRPVAELIPAGKAKGFPFGAGRHMRLAPAGDAWWVPMNDEEVEAWVWGE